MSKSKRERSTPMRKELGEIDRNIEIPYKGSEQDRRYFREFQVELLAYIDEINENIVAYNQALGDTNSSKISVIKNKIESLVMEAIYSFPPDFSSEIDSVRTLFEQQFPAIIQTMNPSGGHSPTTENKAKTKQSYFEKLKQKIANIDEKKMGANFTALLKEDNSLKNGANKEFEFFFGKESVKMKDKISKLTPVSLKSSTRKPNAPSEKAKAKNEIKEFIRDNHIYELDNLQELKNKITAYKSNHDISFSRKIILKTLVSHIEKKIGILLQERANDTQAGPKLPDCNFPELLAKMPADKVAQLAAILAKGKGCKISEIMELLNGIYKEKTPEHLQMKEFLKSHTLEFLGGGNSKNFKVKNIYTENSYVLKLDNRLNAPKQMEAKLMVDLKDTMTPIFAERQTTFKDEKDQLVTRVLLMTVYCTGGDLELDAEKQPSNNKLKAAVNIYRQMAETLETIRATGVLFPDLKNTNWLIDNERKIRIADTKSFLPAKNGFYDASSRENKWYNLLSTRYMNPPEFKQSEFRTDPVHAYQLGKNLYQYLTGCDFSYLYEQGDGAKYNFNYPIFNSPEGLKLKEIIERSVKPDPNARIAVKTMLECLSMLDNKLNPAAIIDNENKKTREIKLDKPRIFNQKKMKDQLKGLFALPEVTAPKIESKQFKLSDASIKIMTNLLSNLEIIERKIGTKYLSDKEKYSTVNETTYKEISQIKNDWRTLQKNANANSIESFKVSCGNSITKIANELAQHRGVWFSEVSAELRALIGVLATITIVPAILVAVASTHGYKDTFFGTPKTDSLAEFDKLNIAKDVDLQLIEDNMGYDKQLK